MQVVELMKMRYDINVNYKKTKELYYCVLFMQITIKKQIEGKVRTYLHLN